MEAAYFQIRKNVILVVIRSLVYTINILPKRKNLTTLNYNYFKVSYELIFFISINNVHAVGQRNDNI